MFVQYRTYNESLNWGCLFPYREWNSDIMWELHQIWGSSEGGLHLVGKWFWGSKKLGVYQPEILTFRFIHSGNLWHWCLFDVAGVWEQSDWDLASSWSKEFLHLQDFLLNQLLSSILLLSINPSSSPIVKLPTSIHPVRKQIKYSSDFF